MKNHYVLIRHGQTYWNKNGIMHGQYDIPLNDKGLSQAERVSEELKRNHFDICFCSPLSRARTTALKILLNHRNTKIIYDDRLKELDKGLLEGKHLNSEKVLKEEEVRILEKYHIESKESFYKRVESLMKEIEDKYKNKRILIVAHSGTIKMIFFYFKKPSIPIYKAYYGLHIKNCKVYSSDTIINIKEKAKMRIGFFPMVADILHSGHILAIEEAKKQCDYLIIGLHCKPSYKSPFQSIYERYMQLRAVKWVDEVIPYENIERDRNVFSSLSYDIYFLGDDHRNKDWELRETIQALGKEIIYLKRIHDYSSTRIKDSLDIDYNGVKLEEGKEYKVEGRK